VTAARSGTGWASRLTPLRLYLALAPLLYLTYAVVTPVFETPDEHQHLFRAWQLASGQLIGERRGEGAGGEVPAGLVQAVERELGSSAPHAQRPVPRSGLAERLGRATSVMPESPVFANFLGSVAYSPAGYGPQMVAVWIGRAGGLTVEGIVRLGRLLNALLTIALIAAALRTLPTGRSLLLAIGLLPMTAACAASFGQDGLIIGATACLVALGVRAAMAGFWSPRSGLSAVALTVVATLAKFVYLPLAGLALLTRSARGRPCLTWPPVVGGLVALLLVGLWFHLVGRLAVPMTPDKPEPGQQLAYIVAHPGTFLSASAHAFSPQSILTLVQQLFVFGWLNVGPVPGTMAPALIALTLAAWLGDEGREKLVRLQRLWILCMIAVTCLGMAMALYLAATPLGADHVEGLQGRYFIPLLLPAGLAVMPRRAEAFAHLPAIVISGMVWANAAAVSGLLRAWYV